jgi:hypothetical protein
MVGVLAKDMSLTAGTSGETQLRFSTTTGPDFPGEYHMHDAPGTTKTVFTSERLSNTVVLSGNQIFTLRGSGTTGIANQRFRVRLYRVDASEVRTLLFQADATANLTTTVTTYTVTGAPASPVTLVPRDRLLIILTTFVPSGSGAAQALLNYNVPASTYVDINSDVAPTFFASRQKLVARRTTAQGVSTYKDLLLERASSGAATTAVVTTVAGATEIQWTYTAGGALAGWVTRRFKYNWRCAPGIISGRVLNHESVSTVNGRFLTRCYLRAVDGTETLLWSHLMTGEINTNNQLSPATIISTGTGVTWAVPTTGITVKPDERIVIKFFVVNIGTMGAGTATITHDQATVPTTPTNDTYLIFIGSPVFKADADPDETPKVADGNMPMMGIGN